MIGHKEDDAPGFDVALAGLVLVFAAAFFVLAIVSAICVVCLYPLRWIFPSFRPSLDPIFPEFDS
jgi:hypothetical protein